MQISQINNLSDHPYTCFQTLFRNAAINTDEEEFKISHHLFKIVYTYKFAGKGNGYHVPFLSGEKLHFYLLINCFNFDARLNNIKLLKNRKS